MTVAAVRNTLDPSDRPGPRLRLIEGGRRSTVSRDQALTRVRAARRRLEGRADTGRFEYLRRSYD